ncbi:hypothetical protein L195_g057350, partial [Trifolium pratense]
TKLLQIASLPFQYLGVPVFKSKPKDFHLQPLADKVKSKLSSWKASLLSIAGRVQLVKSVVQGMLIHCISIYNWPASIIKDIEKWIRNFIWSGHVNKKKLVTVAWKNVCKPYSEGDLGLSSLSCLNEAANMKLCWDLLHSEDFWAVLLRIRVLRHRRATDYHVSSSIWNTIKHQYSNIIKSLCYD